MAVKDLAQQVYKKKKDPPPVCKTCLRLSNAGEIRMERDDFILLVTLARRGFIAEQRYKDFKPVPDDNPLERAFRITREHLALRTARRLLVELARDHVSGVDRSKL